MDPATAAAIGSATSNIVGKAIDFFGGGSDKVDYVEAAKDTLHGKIEAAREHGISPLYALGAPTISPVVGNVGEPSLGETLSSMGQDVSRAVAAGQSDYERELQRLTLEKAGLENDVLRAQTASLNARTAREAAPPFPGAIPEKIMDPTFTKGANLGGGIWPAWESMPGLSDLGAFGQARYGEPGEWVFGGTGLVADAYWNSTVRKAIEEMGSSSGPSAVRQIYDYLFR